MFEASASIGRLSASRPSAYQPCSSSQKSSLKRVVERAAPSRGSGRASPRRRASQAKCARARYARVHVALHLAQGDRRRGERPVGEADAVPRVLPALVGEARDRCGARTRRTRRRRGRRSPRSTRARGRRAGAAGRRRRRRGPSGGARRAASRTAASRRSSRSRPRPSRATAGPPRRSASRGGSCPAPPRSSGFDRRSPWKRASVSSTPSARRARRAGVIHAVSSESRPNTVMNHGAPAAMIGTLGMVGIEDAQRAEVLPGLVAASRSKPSWSVSTDRQRRPPRREPLGGQRVGVGARRSEAGRERLAADGRGDLEARPPTVARGSSVIVPRERAVVQRRVAGRDRS